MGGRRGTRVPLLRSWQQTDVAVCGDTFAMENHLHSGALLVAEGTIKIGVVQEHA